MHRHIGNFAAHEFHTILNKIIYFGGKFYIWIESIFHHLFESVWETHLRFSWQEVPNSFESYIVLKNTKKCNAKIECACQLKRENVIIICIFSR